MSGPTTAEEPMRSRPLIPPTVGRPDPNGDVRCDCHRLLARRVAEGIELRCVRCKRDVLLRWESIDALRSEPVEIGRE